MMPRLKFDETKLLLARRTISPRTFRIGVGQSVLVGSILGIDVIECSATTLYVTIWMSNAATTFMGKVCSFTSIIDNTSRYIVLLYTLLHGALLIRYMLTFVLICAILQQTERADVHRVKEAGKMLVPLIGDDKKADSPIHERPELGEYVKTSVEVSGTDWKKSSVDIAVAGMGWIAIGLKVIILYVHRAMSCWREREREREREKKKRKTG